MSDEWSRIKSTVYPFGTALWETNRPVKITLEDGTEYDFSSDNALIAKMPETKLISNGGKKPNFGTRPDVRKRRMEIYNRQESIRNGRITIQNLAEEYVLSRRTIEEDLRKLGIARK